MGALFEVYKDKGCGFLESVYQECVGIEFTEQKIPFLFQPKLQIAYKGKPLTQTYIPDFLCYNSIIVEIKSVTTLLPAHRSQTINYLKATQLQLGLLINFGHHPKLQHERILADDRRSSKTLVQNL